MTQQEIIETLERLKQQTEVALGTAQSRFMAVASLPYPSQSFRVGDFMIRDLKQRSACPSCEARVKAIESMDDRRKQKE